MDDQVPGGYNGRILRIDLSNLSISSQVIDADFCRKYLGGFGFVAYSLLSELGQGVDPLSPENKLIFATGPLTGLPLSGADRLCIGAKSPLTGGIAVSEAGGFFGSELKRAGYDAIIIEGKADKPAYVSIRDGEATIQDASRLWGSNTKEAQGAIRDELGDEHIRLAQIGPAGENLVLYANIMCGLHDTAGRGGLGAVMGAKNLKAVAVRGHTAPPPRDSQSVKELRDWLSTNAPNMPGIQSFREYGLGAGLAGHILTGNLPVRNFRDGLFDEVEKLDAKTIKDTVRIGMRGCFACIVRCKKVVKFEDPYLHDPAYGGPEYETLASLGSNCGIEDLKAVCKGNELCNAYSLDTISTGAVIAFAMECFENGILTTEETHGIELRFGSSEAMLKMIELIARRDGVGDLLANGVARASQRIGKDAEKFAMHVKGYEIPMHEPRLKLGLGLGYMVNPHGADHCHNIQDTLYVRDAQMTGLRPFGFIEPFSLDDIGPRKVALFKFEQLKHTLNDSLLVCMLLPYSLEQLTHLVAATTGWDTGIMELLRTAERILNMARLFNIREGLTATDDRLPERFFQPKTDGALSNKPMDKVKMEKAKSYYYRLMGWDAEGIPEPEKLEELGLSGVGLRQ